MSDDGPLGGMFNPAAPDPRDPATVAAEHQAAFEAAQSPSPSSSPPASRHPAGAHRATHQPGRLLLPALIGVLGVCALVVGLVGWFHNDSSDSSGLVTKPSTSGPVGTSPSASTSPSPSTSPSSTASEDVSESASPTPSKSASPTATATTSDVIVYAPSVVLNQTRTVGLAARVAARLRAQGWTVTGTGNWRGSIASTTVYYPAGMEAAAQSLAHALGVDRVRPRVAGMLNNRLTVVLTSNPFA